MSTSKDALPVSYAQPGLTINWGSILSGLVFIMALGWLLFTLGSAIGLSIADVDNLHGGDKSSNTAALGTAATVWILVTVIATYFLGGFLAGKVSGRIDKPTGLLHGVVLWSCTIIIGIIFSAIGVSGIMNAAAGAAKSVTSTGAQAVSMMAGGHKDIGSSQLASFLHPLTGSLKQDLNKALEKARQDKKDADTKNKDSNNNDAQHQHGSSQSGAQNSSSAGSSTAGSSTSESSEKGNDAAEPSPSANTDDDASNNSNSNGNNGEESAMTEDSDDEREGREAQSPPRAEQQKPAEGENTRPYSRENSEKHYHSREKSYHHHATGYHSKSAESPIEKIDPQVLMAVALALIQGDERRAKGIMTSHFDIEEAEIDRLIKAAKQKSEQAAKELEKKMNDAKDYAAGLLWVIFLSYLIGLLACISGAQLAMKSPNLLDTASSKNSADKR